MNTDPRPNGTRVPFSRSAVLLIIGLSTFTLLGIRVSVRYITPPRPRNLLYVAEEKLRLGDVWASRHHLWTVPIKNVSTDPVTVTDIRVSCGCTTVKPVAFVLQPGESQDLLFTLDLERTGNSANDSESFSVSFAPIIQGGLSFTDGWELKARVKSTYAIEDTNVVYDGAARLVAGKTHPPTSIPVQRLAPGIELTVDCPEHLGHAALIGNDASGGVILQFTPSTSLNVGMHVGEMTVTSHLQGESLGKREIAIKLHVVGAVEALPHDFDFGPVEIGQPLEGEVLVTSSRGTSFTVLEDVGQEADIAFTAHHKDASRQHWVTVRIPKALEGQHTLDALVVIREESGTVELLEIPISYRGVRLPH